MINKKAARRYTQALYEIAQENNAVEIMRQDFFCIRKAIEGSHELKVFLASPIITFLRKAKIISIIFEGKVNKITLLFLEILCKKNRSGILYDISVDFNDLLNLEQGVLETNIKTAIEMSEAEKKMLSDNLARYTGLKIEPSFSVDASIKGGFVAKFSDTIIDASIKRQLELLFEQFKEGSVKTN